MELQDFKLGSNVLDPVTGLVGLAVQLSQSLSGSVQVAIQPKGEGAEIPEARTIDIHLLETVDAGISDKVPTAQTTTIPLGAKVKDIASGFEGIFVDLVTEYSGKLLLGVQPPMGKDKSELPSIVYFVAPRMEQVGPGVSKPPLAVDKDAPVVKKPGGPSRPMIRSRGV